MGSLKKGMTSVLIIVLSLLIAKPAFAELPSSPNTTPINQTFYYYLRDFTVTYKIQRLQDDFYLITFSPTNPVPIQVNFYEQLPNGTEHIKTGIIQVGGYGGYLTTKSYPRDITMIELSNEPTSTPLSSTSPIPSPAQTCNPSPSLLPSESSVPTPTVPEFSWLITLPLFLSILFFGVLIRRRKVCLTISGNIK